MRSSSLLILLCCVLFAFSTVNAELSGALIRSKRQYYGGFYKKTTVYGPGGLASRTVGRGPYGGGFSKTVIYGMYVRIKADPVELSYPNERLSSYLKSSRFYKEKRGKHAGNAYKLHLFDCGIVVPHKNMQLHMDQNIKITLIAATLIFIAIAAPIDSQDGDDGYNYGDYGDGYPGPECEVVNGTKLYIDGEFKRNLNATEQRQYMEWKKIVDAHCNASMANGAVSVDIDPPDEPEFCRDY